MKKFCTFLISVLFFNYSFINSMTIESVNYKDYIVITINDDNETNNEIESKKLPIHYSKLARIACLLDQISAHRASPFLDKLLEKCVEKMLPNFFCWN